MIAVNDLSYSISRKSLLNNISFQLKSGEILAVLGANGAGKSTLLKMLSGEITIYSGTVTINQHNLNAWDINQLAKLRAVIGQQQVSVQSLRAIDVVLLGRIPYCNGYYRQKDFEIAYESLEKTNALVLAERYYNELSGGEKQRIQLARALCQLESDNDEFCYLFLDEFNAYLDIHYQQQLLKLLNKVVKGKNIAIFMIIHDLNLALHYASHALALKEGRVAAYGKTVEVLTESTMKNVFQTKSTLVHFDQPPYKAILPYL